MRIPQPLLDVRVQFVLAASLATTAWVSFPRAKAEDHANWEVICPPHPMSCEVPGCQSCQVILAEYARMGTPLKP